MKKHIPNIITLLNLFSGIIAAILAIEGRLVDAGLFVVLGIFFDFFDGFVARLLKVEGELGKQLDSLADMVTSGLVPGIVMFQLLRRASGVANEVLLPTTILEEGYSYLPLLGFVITLSAAYRLANFNIDTRQASSFIGIPTPANALLVLSFPLILKYSTLEVARDLIQSSWFLILITLLGSYLMNANIPLFSLKFKEYSVKNNVIKYVFIILTFLLFLLLQYIAIPICILLYVVLSVVDNRIMNERNKA